MNILLDSFSDFTPASSIVSGDPKDSNDTTKPYTYIEWLKYTGVSATDTQDYFAQYNTYLYNWSTTKKKNQIETNNVIFESYKTLLKDITLKYTNDEEKRFLHNLNLSNPRHVESALPFFADKIKSIALHYAFSRDRIKQQKHINNKAGTSSGLNLATTHWVTESHTKPSILTLSANIKPIRLRGTRIHELYDISSEFNTDIIDYDTAIFTNLTQAIRNVLTECRPALKLSSELTLVLSGKIADIREESFPDEITTLPVDKFIDYKRDVNELNVRYQQEYIEKLTGETLFIPVSGGMEALVTPTQPWRNLLSRYGPVITNKRTNLRLFSTKQLGRYFLPQHTGLLTYYSLAPTPVFIGESPADTVYPDVNKYGNSYVSGVTGLNVRHVENVEWLKADMSNDQLHGDVINIPNIARFNGYMSIDDMRSTSDQGMSRHTDSYDFFTGEKNNIWSNEDIYTLEAKNVYDIDGRQSTLFVTHDTLYNWREDMYGNEYGIYKRIEDQRNPMFNPFGPEDDFDAQAGCVVIDGGDSLVERPSRFEEEYDIYDGGRHPKTDPKIEQLITWTAFPDIRRTDPTTGEPVDHNTHYYGVSLDGKSGELDYYPVTFHGFNPFPDYDKQAYGGLFTDDACGILGARYTGCEIADNYSFILFTEGPDADGNYISDPYELENTEFSAFDRIANPMFDEFDPDIGFSAHGAPSGVELIQADNIDGSVFTSECDFEGQDFKYEVDQTAELFLDVLTIGKTKLQDIEDDPDYTRPTVYEQKANVPGTVNFRSYNSKTQTNISHALSTVWDGLDSISNTAYEKVKQDIDAGDVLNFDIFNDVIAVETKDYVLLEKINFEMDTTTVLPNKSKNILLNTGVVDSVEKNGDWFFDEYENTALLCMTKIHDHENGEQIIHPVVYNVDLETLNYTQIFPNKDFGIQEGIDEFMLPDDLSNLRYEFVDRPILNYNEDLDYYNITFTSQLSGADNTTKFCVFNSSYVKRKLNFELLDATVYHGESVDRYTFPGNSWQSRVDRKYLRLTLPEGEMPPATGQVKTFQMSSKNFIGYSLSGLGLELELDMKFLPVDDYKIISILFDPGDGSEIKVNQRLIENDFVDVSFDITKLPDQSDFGDPRRLPMIHEYTFANSEETTYTPRVSAIYSDYSVIQFEIEIETSPYSLQSGFDGIKLINTKQYLDPAGNKKQLLVLETQNPHHITNVALTV